MRRNTRVLLGVGGEHRPSSPSLRWHLDPDPGGSQLGEEGLSQLGCSPDTPRHCSWLLTCFGASLTHSGLPPRLSMVQRWGGSGQPLLQPATELTAGRPGSWWLVGGRPRPESWAHHSHQGRTEPQRKLHSTLRPVARRGLFQGHQLGRRTATFTHAGL